MRHALGNRRGTVLIVGMGVLVSLVFLVSATSFIERTELRLAGRAGDRAVATTCASAGLERAVAAARLQAQGGSVPDTLWQIELGAGMSRLVVPGTPEVTGMRVEDARVNLNTVDAAVLALLPGCSPDLAERIIAERKRLNQARNSRDPLDLIATDPVPASVPRWWDLPFSDLDVLANAVPAARTLVSDPRFRAVVTCRSSGRVDVGSAERSVLLALGIPADAVSRLHARRWDHRAAFLAAAGLADDGWHKYFVAVRPGAWRALALGRCGSVEMVAEAVIAVDRRQLRIIDANLRERADSALLAWMLP